MVLWDYLIERRSLIHNTIPCPMFHNNGITPHEVTLGTPAYTSNLCVYVCYEWTYYHDHETSPENRDKLGRVLGPIKTK